MDIEDNKQYCVFGIFVKGEFQGWRQDTMGTLGKKWAKIYGYHPEQVEIIKNNTKEELNSSATSLMKFLFGEYGGVLINTEGQLLDSKQIIQQVQKSEEEKRSWGEFELRVYPIPFYYDEYEEWKMEAFNANLPEPLEIHKFKTLNNEN